MRLTLFGAEMDPLFTAILRQQFCGQHLPAKFIQNPQHFYLNGFLFVCDPDLPLESISQHVTLGDNE